MSGPGLLVVPSVVRETVRLAAQGVPGVARVGWSGGLVRRWLAGPPVTIGLDGPRTTVRVTIVARPGGSLQALTDLVRAAVVAALDRQLGLVPGEITVSVDGVGA